MLGLIGFFWVVVLGSSITIILFALFKGSADLMFSIFRIFPFLYIIFAIIVSEIYARMSYNRWFYEFTDHGLKVESGIIWKKYSDIPYERIQNIEIHRGIIARMLGFSSLIIHTAGYSAQILAEGYIPAVEMNRAEEIRNFVMKKITNK